MFAVTAQEVFAKRKRGPKGKFESSDQKLALLVFLSNPSRTYKEAAAHFGCSVELIDKVIARIKAESIKQLAPGPQESPGLASSTPEGAPQSVPEARPIPKEGTNA